MLKKSLLLELNFPMTFCRWISASKLPPLTFHLPNHHTICNLESRSCDKLEPSLRFDVIVHYTGGLSVRTLIAVCPVRKRFVKKSYSVAISNVPVSIPAPMLDRSDFESWQQRLPKDIYTLINHYTDSKYIWDNVKMLLEGFELTKVKRESQLYDEFEHFRQNKGETIHEYYVRFTKLINDMRNIKMTMPKMQLNSKFVNNMLSEWDRFMTSVKLNRGLYAYLKQHEAHANENEMMLERYNQHAIDPFVFLSNVSP
ncbi:hypothetical protein Tco_0596019 [Tanacetum coccineum]